MYDLLEKQLRKHFEPADEFATPVNTSPVTSATYTDNPPYGPHDYFVTALAATGPPRVESDPSLAVSATFKDLVAPPPPTAPPPRRAEGPRPSRSDYW